MDKLNFSTSINAPKEKVWQTLWDDASYRKWTTAFTEGSYAVTDNWKEGTDVKFLDPKGSGMISRVAASGAAFLIVTLSFSKISWMFLGQPAIYSAMVAAVVLLDSFSITIALFIFQEYFSNL